MTKEEARILQKKRILEINDRAVKENKIQQILSLQLVEHKKIIGYRADKWEVNLDPLWNHPVFTNTTFYFPRVVSKEERKIEFVLPKHWEKGAYGIVEPVGDEFISPSEADVSIIPSLGFQRNGFRLGRGAGFYDRAFSRVDSKKMIGISFSELFSIDFPFNDYDIRVGELITDSGVLFF